MLMISTCACDLPQRRAPLRRSFFLSARFDGGCTLVPTLPAPEHRWATFLRGTRRDRFLIQIHNGAPGIFQIVPPHRGCPSNKRVSLSTDVDERCFYRSGDRHYWRRYHYTAGQKNVDTFTNSDGLEKGPPMLKATPCNLKKNLAGNWRALEGSKQGPVATSVHIFLSGGDRKNMSLTLSSA